MKAKYQSTPAIEVITWADHSANHRSEEYTLNQIAKRIKEDFVNRNVGFVVYEDERRVCIAAEARIDADLEETLYSHYTTILKATIETRLKYKESLR